MVLQVYKDLTKNELEEISSDFINKCPWRQEVFGKFSRVQFS